MATERKIKVAEVCRQLGFTKQAYYKSLQQQKRGNYNQVIAKDKVLQIRSQQPRIGTRKLYHLLFEDFRREGIGIGRDKLFDLLRAENLLVAKKRRYTKTTNSRHWMKQYPNLIQDISLSYPEQLWVADITYLAVGNGYMYLHLITDAYSKLIVGYELSENLAASKTMNALRKALLKRQYNTTLIHHSDRGLQYCSSGYTKILKENNIAISMTQDGNPYDNAIAERVNGILKEEFGLGEVLEDFNQAKLQTSQAISLYNNKRPHLSCQMLTPREMHNQTSIQVKRWSKRKYQKQQNQTTSVPSFKPSKTVNQF